MAGRPRLVVCALALRGTIVNSWRERWTDRNPDWLVYWLRMILRVSCPLYFAAVSLRNTLFDLGIRRSFCSQIPVISVGNLSVGGTGKTPAVAWIVRWLGNRGRRVVVLSRGYGKLAEGRNDEALELEMKIPGVPHLQHWDRVASAKRAVREIQAEVIVLDDGFQHRRLSRNLDVVLLDATDTPAAQWLLPAGLRREPFSSLRRAKSVLITRSDQVQPSCLEDLIAAVHRENPNAICLPTVHRPQSLFHFPDRHLPLGQLKGAQVFAFCAIGNHRAFIDTLESLGAKLVGQRTWPDHHAYSADDLQWLDNWASQHPETTFVCTVKDWVKIRQANIGNCILLALCIELEFLEGSGQFEKLLECVIHHQPNAAEDETRYRDA